MIDSLTNSGTTGAATTTPLTGGSELGKAEFLELLVAQLQNQDPLNPTDPTEFTAQLAQFSSLEQLFNVNESLAEMTQALQDNQNLERLSAVGMIGRQVEVTGPDFHYDGSPVEFGYILDAPATAVNVKILDAQGEVVAVLPQAEGEAGSHYYSWDGTGLNGLSLAPGDYQLQAERIDGESATSVSTRIRGVVSGVELGDLESVLTTNAGDFGLADVVNVTGS